MFGGILEARVRPEEQQEVCFQAAPLIPLLPARWHLTLLISAHFAIILDQPLVFPTLLWKELIMLTHTHVELLRT